MNKNTQESMGGNGALGRGFGRRKKRMIRDVIHTFTKSLKETTVGTLYLKLLAKKIYKCLI